MTDALPPPPSSEPPVTEAELHAYADRQLTTERMAEVAAWLARRPDDSARVRAWLFAIMHNLHVDAARRGRLATVALDEHTPEGVAPPTQGERLAVLDLQSALDRLAPEQREVLLLVALEDMAYADIAQTLGIPLGTVMSRLSRGRERLRLLLDGVPSAPGGDAVRLKVVK